MQARFGKSVLPPGTRAFHPRRAEGPQLSMRARDLRTQDKPLRHTDSFMRVSGRQDDHALAMSVSRRITLVAVGGRYSRPVTEDERLQWSPAPGRQSRLMVFRLLYRLLLQRLGRETETVSETSAGARRSASGISGACRRIAKTPILVLGAVTLAAAVLVVSLPAVQKQAGGSSTALALDIPAVDASPLVIHLQGADLESSRPPLPGFASVARIQSIDGRFFPEFQVVSPAAIVEMVNADTVAHNTHVFSRGETVFNVALPVQGVTVRKVLTGSGIFRVHCDMHPWMKAWIFIPPSRHHAVVHDPTTLHFTNLDPGEYTLHVWQPDRGESLLPLSLEAGETRHLRMR